MKIFRVTFKWSETTNQEIDVPADNIIDSIEKGLTFLQKRGYTYKLDHCYKVELISEPVNIMERS